MLFATWLPARDAAALSLVRLVNEVTGTADERQYIGGVIAQTILYRYAGPD